MANGVHFEAFGNNVLSVNRSRLWDIPPRFYCDDNSSGGLLGSDAV